MARPASAKPRRVAVALTTSRERVALVLLALAPVAIMPEALNRFVFVKVAVAAAGVAVACVGEARGALPRPAVAGIVAGGALLVISASIGAAPLAALLGRGPRYEGLPVLAVYAGVALAGARLLGPQRPPDAGRWLGRALAVAVIAVAFIAVLEAAGLRPLSSNVARPGSLLGNASDEGAYAVLVLGPLVALGVALRDPLLYAGAAAAGVTVVLSASRGALVGLVVAAIVLGLAMRTRGIRVVVAAGLVAAAVLVLAIPQVRHRAFGESSFAGHTTSGRVLLWKEALAVVGHHPVLGVGPNGFEDAVVTQHDRRWQHQVGPADPPDSPHDWVLQAAAAGGIPLALLALCGAAYVGRRAVGVIGAESAGRAPPLAAGLAAGLAGYLVALLVHLTAPGPTMLAALFAGVLVATPEDPRIEPTWQRIGLTSVAAATSIFMLVCAVAEIPLRSAIVDVTDGNLAAAKDHFDIAQALRPWDVEVPLAAGHAYAAASLAGVSGAAAYGRPWLVDASRRVPTSEQAQEDLAAVDAGLGDLASARRLLDRALARDRYNPELLLRRGVVEAEQKDYAGAERDFLAAAGIATRSPQPWQDLGTLYALEKRPDDAARAQREAASRRGP